MLKGYSSATLQPYLHVYGKVGELTKKSLKQAQNTEEVLAIVKLPLKVACEPNEFPYFPNKGPYPSSWTVITRGFKLLGGKINSRNE